ncbi:MAG TPA: hypothetical protein VFY49_12100, partial [Myxococcota bacterium]|nr:hypothetical protein [Myxococcota bacterium]
RADGRLVGPRITTTPADTGMSTSIADWDAIATITLGGVHSDVAADFSTTNNPNGVWQYGWSTMLGSPFVLSTHPAVRDGVATWRGDLEPFRNPAEYHNGTTSVLILGDTNPMNPGQFALHPGPNGENAVVRYVAPETGTASIASIFSSVDIFETTTDFTSY